MSSRWSRLLLATLATVFAGWLAFTPAVNAAPARTPTHDEPHPVVMKQVGDAVATARVRTVPAASSSGAAVTNGASAPAQNAQSNGLQREVFGFALASSLNDPTVGYPSWNFSLLSTVAFFGLHVNDDGTIANDSGLTVWNSTQLTDLVTTAHSHGVKVVLTVIKQDFNSGTPDMCAALAQRATTVSQTTAQVAAKSVDGVNLDYEGLNGTCPNGQTARSMMTDFARQMRAALPTGSYLSVDTYASSAADSLGFFDVAGLNAYVDSFFVMAYDLEYSNYSHPPTSCVRFCLGPTSPLTSYFYSDTTTAAQYTSAVGAGKVILGVPYYGRKACVASATANQYPTSAVVADTYLDAISESSQPQVQSGSYAMHRDGNDPSGQERWDTWYNTTLACNRELYWDDTVSLGNKYDLVNSDALRGVGIWNLNYGGGASELWNTLFNHFVGCTGATVAASPASPQPRGGVVQLTATSSGCANPVYEFWLQYPGGSWVMTQAFSPSATWSWDTSANPTGNYVIHVWANQAGGTTSTWQAFGEATYALSVPPPCTAATLMPSAVSKPAGSTIALTAGSASCPNARYEFWVGYPDGSWTLVQGWGGTTFSWNTTGLAPGNYAVHVWANQAGDSTGTWESLAASSVALSVCTSAAVSPASAGAPVGSTVSLSASSAGCASPQYEYWVQYPDGSWNLVRGWGGASFSWNTTGLALGTYTFHVWAINQGDPTSTYEAYGTAVITVNGCTSATVTPSGPTAAAGSTVSLTTSASGCANPQYEYWVQYPNGTWNLARGWGGAAFSWITSGLTPGTYTFHVWANNQGDPMVTYETYGNDVVTLSGCTSVSVTSSSTGKGFVTFTGTASGCPNPVYEFWLQYPDGTWHLMQGFGGNAWEWNSAGFPRGSYVLHVWANNQGADTSTWEAYGTATETLS